MDQRAIDALVEAGLNNRLQIFGALRRGAGACAMGVILGAEAEKRELLWLTVEPRWASWSDPQVSCPHCEQYGTEAWLIVHCNDVHQWDFLTIARKLEHLVAPPHEST